MEVKAPYCLKCPYFISPPKVIGGKATCKAYSNGIPKAGVSVKKKGVKSGGGRKK